MTTERPRMRIEKCAFETKADVFRDMAETGFWPTTYVSRRSPELPLHWHEGDTIGYVMEGSTYLLDENGDRCELEAGDKLIIPAGALHAEGEINEPVTYIVTTEKPVPFLEAFRMLEPGAYPEPRSLTLTDKQRAALGGTS